MRAAGAGLVLSSMVGLPGRSLERLQGEPLPVMDASGSLKETAARECGVHQEILVSSVHGHFRRQTWCCESGFHQSRLLQSIPFRDSRPLGVSSSRRESMQKRARRGGGGDNAVYKERGEGSARRGSGQWAVSDVLGRSQNLLSQRKRVQAA
jgi:hypothetical protein